jgi:hypothetical protein
MSFRTIFKCDVCGSEREDDPAKNITVAVSVWMTNPKKEILHLARTDRHDGDSVCSATCAAKLLRRLAEKAEAFR